MYVLLPKKKPMYILGQKNRPIISIVYHFSINYMENCNPIHNTDHLVDIIKTHSNKIVISFKNSNHNISVSNVSKIFCCPT